MMEHVKALAIKGLMTIVGLYLVLGLGFGVSLMTILAITVVLGVISYVFGDLLLYPKTTNMVASTADVGLSIIIIAIVGSIMGSPDQSSWISAGVLAGIVLGAGEFFFHNYIAKKPELRASFIK
ncbi:DUF2512 family protein [Halobacillus sp. B23F22_1]|uniref:DUF2512 family protein n=1 Tax=Halobacillus sp. B23F22_1 TaxID=3459514 RepID=UPI00373EF46B